MKINEMNENQLIEGLKLLLKEEKEEKLKHLNMLFNASEYLSADMILDALIEKVERDLENEQVDDHMIRYAENILEALNKIYLVWEI